MSRIGRPSKYSEELADAICTRLAQGESMRSVCRDEDMPVMDTMWRWIREKEDFSEQYARAKQESADAIIEDILDIADEGEDVARDRLRIDARKWVASKLKPKKYGDTTKLEDELPINYVITIGGADNT